MSRDVVWALVIAFALCLVGSTIIGILVASEVARRQRRREKAERLANRRAIARTSVFSRTEIQDLLHQVDAETVLLRKVDPTELPRRVHSGWRRVR